MLKKEELFVLIKSLSKSEKRYFKMGFGQGAHENSAYMALFDVLDKQKEYDEDEVRRKLNGLPIVKQLHVGKNYLSHQILRSLRNYHGSISKDAEVKDILRNAEILYKRELFKHCQNELQRAKKMAELYELDALLIEILGWERRLVQATSPTDFKSINDIVKNQKEATDRLFNTIKYWELTTEISTSIGTPMVHELGNSSLLANDQLAQTIEAKVLYYHCLYYTNLQGNNTEKGAKSLRKLITYLETQPSFIKEDPGMYISTVNNYVTFLIFTKRFDDAFKYLDKINQLFKEVSDKKRANRILQKQIFRTMNIELELYRDLKKYDHEKITSIEDHITRNESKIPYEYLISFWYQLSFIYFDQKLYSRALHWINHLMQSKTSARPDILIHSRMLNLLIHFELKNFMVLGYFMESTKRYLSLNSSIEPYQKLIFQFLGKSSKIPHAEINAEFKILREKLFGGEEMISNNVLDYIDYEKWIDSHLN